MGDTGPRERPTCWVVTDGKVGMEVQCLGLAEALGLEPAVKRIDVPRPWRWLAPRFIRDPLARLGPDGDALAPPWPDVLIGSGRQAIAPSIAIRHASGGGTFTIQVQNPGVDPTRFDVVVAPKHDGLEAPNVVTTTGSLNRITPERLAAAAERFGSRFDDLPRPLVAVLLGGDNKVYRMTRHAMRRLGERLAALSRREGAGLLVSPSRRTNAKALDALSGALETVTARIWDGQGENPYFGFLALADAFVVTADSVNMVCEAATTGKPVYVVDLDGGSRKFRRFRETLRADGITRSFDGRVETWTYPPLRDTQDAAVEIGRRWRERGMTEAAPAA